MLFIAGILSMFVPIFSVAKSRIKHWSFRIKKPFFFPALAEGLWCGAHWLLLVEVIAAMVGN